MSDLVFVRAGTVGYAEAWAEQRRLHAARVAGDAPDTVLLLDHPPVFTAGRRTQDAERPTDGTPVIDVDRGGKITWHGPGQLTGYPIVALPDRMNVVAHVRRLEQALMGVCADFGLHTELIPGRSGVWVAGDDRGPDRKVAAIGIRVSQGVTMHGFGLNCDPDLSWFDRIVPCGIPDAAVSSLTRELGRPVGVPEVLDAVERHLRQVLAPVATGTARRAASAGSASAGSAHAASTGREPVTGDTSAAGSVAGSDRLSRVPPRQRGEPRSGLVGGPRLVLVRGVLVGRVLVCLDLLGLAFDFQRLVAGGLAGLLLELPEDFVHLDFDVLDDSHAGASSSRSGHPDPRLRRSRAAAG
ncbi:hypothetical protein BH20ACT5_BH20ACT5_25750 [soil metagenome]